MSKHEILVCICYIFKQNLMHIPPPPPPPPPSPILVIYERGHTSHIIIGGGRILTSSVGPGMIGDCIIVEIMKRNFICQKFEEISRNVDFYNLKLIYVLFFLD